MYNRARGGFYFNSRPCERGDAYGGHVRKINYIISILAPARGATFNRDVKNSYILFQFSPLREGRLLADMRKIEMQFISILAPARGATTHLGKAHQGVTISILAPARGATHRHVGARPAGDISILAPARGATPPVFRFRESLDGFQFSPLREGRPRSGSSPQRRPYFNSRPCERGDASQAPRFHQAAISILAPARGATDSTAIRWYIQAFQFSPLREGRLHPSTYKIAKSHFNSRPCERGDHLLTEYNADTGLFQFSPLREGRPTQYVLRSASQFISILAPARGATIPPEDLVFGTVISILAPARGATQHARTTPPAKLFQFSPLREGRRCTRSNRYHRDTYFNSRPCERGDMQAQQGFARPV